MKPVHCPARLLQFCLLLGCLALLRCGTRSGSSGNTNWLMPCSTDSECGTLVCSCNHCEEVCGERVDCSKAPGATCILSGTPSEGGTETQTEGGAETQTERSLEASDVQEAKAPPNESGPACDPESNAVCSAARHLSSAADFVAAVNELAWQRVSVSTTGVLTLSNDLVADADLRIDASLLTGPSYCRAPDAGADDAGTLQCRTPLLRESAFPRRNVQGRVAGVSCEQPGDLSAFFGDSCMRIAIAKDTTFRLRAVVQDLHPSPYVPFVEIERACAFPCDASETRCAATQTCFARGYAACAYCEEKAAALCACRDVCGSKPESSACTFASSPDVDVRGTCKASTCVTGN